MSFWSRLWRRVSPPDAPAGGQTLEDRGDFAGAALEYEREGLQEDALRVLLASADADPDAAGRVRILARALRLAGQLGDPPQELRARYARARLDVLRPSHPGAASVWELSSLARELEELEEFEAAAEAYGLSGDRGGQVRLLSAAGKIEELEGILASENERTRSGRLRTQFFADIVSLTSGGQRVEALRRARVFADLNPSDDEVLALLRSLQERLLKPPSAHLEWEGVRARRVLLPEVTLGRAGADIDLSSPLLSRRHLLFHAREGVPVVEDLATRNGTFLAGARLAAPLQVRSPLALALGGELPCEVSPWGDSGLRLLLGGEVYLLPLAAHAAVGPWVLEASQGGECLHLRVPPGAPPPLLDGSVAAAAGLDLCLGDAVHLERGGAPVLRVLP